MRLTTAPAFELFASFEQHGAMGLCLFRSAALFLLPQGAPARTTLNVRRRSGAKHKTGC